jgi:hypothetical protein
MKAIYSAGNENEQALGAWMDRLGMNPAEKTDREA